MWFVFALKYGVTDNFCKYGDQSSGGWKLLWRNSSSPLLKALSLKLLSVIIQTLKWNWNSSVLLILSGRKDCGIMISKWLWATCIVNFILFVSSLKMVLNFFVYSCDVCHSRFCHRYKDLFNNGYKQLSREVLIYRDISCWFAILLGGESYCLKARSYFTCSRIWTWTVLCNGWTYLPLQHGHFSVVNFKTKITLLFCISCSLWI